MLHRRLLALALALFVLSPAPSAIAASATQTGYDDDTVVKEDTDEGTSADNTPSDTPDTAQASPSATASTNLPFTGLEAGLIAAAGLGLAGTGVALRRAAREQN